MLSFPAVERLLQRFSLKYQIAFVGIAALIGFIAVGGFYVLSNRTVEGINTQYQRADRADKALIAIDLAMLEARRAEKDFQLRRENRYVDNHATTMKGADEQFATLAGNLDAAADRALAGETKSLSAAYAAAFAKLVSTETAVGLTENDALQGAMRKSVHAVETALKAHDDPSLEVSMLTMRRQEKDFLARVEARYVDAIKATATEFAARLAKSSLPEAKRGEIAAHMAAYQKDFLSLADGVLAARAAAKQMSDAYAAFAPKLEALGKSVHAIQADAQQRIDQARAEASRNIMTAIGVATVLVAAICFFVGIGIFRPLRQMTETMGRLAGKDWTTSVPAQDRRDEIGEMAKAVQVFKDAGIENERLQAEAKAAEARQREQELATQAERERLAAEAAAETERKLRALEEAMKKAEADRQVAEERMRAEAEAKRKAEMNTLADGFEASVRQVVQTVSAAATQVQSSSSAMASTAEETTQQASAVAAASEQASANVQTVAAASEELTSSITEIARQVAQSAAVANQASERAKATGSTVDGLAQAAQKIGEVVNMITSIASQTNLLALNATIEAARAGEAGKGFAVVASEVKSLANQTGKATEEISRQIAAVQEATRNAVDAIQGIGATIEEINQISTTIAAAVEEQTSATNEISRNVQEASTGTMEVSRNIGGVSAAAAAETGQGAEQMKGAATELSRQAATLATEVDDFIARIRAA